MPLSGDFKIGSGGLAFSVQQLFPDQLNVASQRVKLVRVRQRHSYFFSMAFQYIELLQQRAVVVGVYAHLDVAQLAIPPENA